MMAARFCSFDCITLLPSKYLSNESRLSFISQGRVTLNLRFRRRESETGKQFGELLEVEQKNKSPDWHWGLIAIGLGDVSRVLRGTSNAYSSSGGTCASNF